MLRLMQSRVSATTDHVEDVLNMVSATDPVLMTMSSTSSEWSDWRTPIGA